MMLLPFPFSVRDTVRKRKKIEIITGALFELTVPSLRALQQPAAQHCSVVYEALCIYAHAINFFMERAEVLKRIEAMLQEERKKNLSHRLLKSVM